MMPHIKYLIYNSNNENYYFTADEAAKDEALSQGHEVVDVENLKVLQASGNKSEVEEYFIDTDKVEEESEPD